MSSEERRLRRQFAVIARNAPALRSIINLVLSERMRMFRIPFACLLIIGSFLSFLPVFGLWMLPLGLMLLAIDVPALRPMISGAIIRLRRRIDLWRQRRKGG